MRSHAKETNSFTESASAVETQYSRVPITKVASAVETQYAEVPISSVEEDEVIYSAIKKPVVKSMQTQVVKHTKFAPAMRLEVTSTDR
jgi:hypothetical protein